MNPSVVWFLVALALFSCAAVLLALLAWRRHQELRVGGVEVALRTGEDTRGRGWHLGVAHYRGEDFAWYRVLSLRRGPNWVLNRSEVEIVTRREPSDVETYSMPSGATVLNLACMGKHLEVAMGADALTGFLSWLESAPPGRSVPWAS